MGSAPADASGQGGTQRALPWLLAGVAVLGVGISCRLALLNATDLWLDEAATVLMGGLSPGALLELLRHESHPPLYYLMVGGLFRLTGAAALTVRLLSLVGSVVLLLVLLRARLPDAPRSVGLAAAALLSVHPLALYFGVEGKMYLLLWLCAAAQLAALCHGTRRALVVAACAQCAALYLHNFGALLVPTWGAALVLSPKGERRAIMVACVASLSAWLPWAVMYLPGQIEVQTAQDNFKEQVLAGVPPLKRLWSSVSVMAGVPPFGAWLRTLGLVPRGVASWLGLALYPASLLGAIALWRRGQRRTLGVLSSALVSTWLLLWILDGWAPLFLPGRYETTALIPLAWLAACALRAPDPRAARVGAALFAMALVGAGSSGQAFIAQPEVHRFKNTVRHLVEQHRPFNNVITVGFAYAPLRVAALELLDEPDDFIAFPSAARTSPGERAPKAYAPEALHREAQQLAARAPATLAVIYPDYEEVWFLTLQEALLRAGYAQGAIEKNPPLVMVSFAAAVPAGLR